jgi:hypothetical protein
MAQRGKISTAHEYNNNGQCIHCRMYKVNVDRLSHICTHEREALADSCVPAQEKSDGK